MAIGSKPFAQVSVEIDRERHESDGDGQRAEARLGPGETARLS